MSIHCEKSGKEPDTKIGRKRPERSYDLSGVPSFLMDHPTVLTWAAGNRKDVKRAVDYIEESIIRTQGVRFDDMYDDLPKGARKEIGHILQDVVSKSDMDEVRSRAKGTFGDTMDNIDKWLQAETSRLGISGKNMGKKGEQKRGNPGKR